MFKYKKLAKEQALTIIELQDDLDYLWNVLMELGQELEYKDALTERLVSSEAKVKEHLESFSTCPECHSDLYVTAGHRVQRRCFSCGYPVTQQMSNFTDVRDHIDYRTVQQEWPRTARGRHAK